MIKFGIIGSSQISEKFCYALQQLQAKQKNICIYANYSRSEEIAQNFARQFDIYHPTTNLNTLFNLVDVVYIATPNSIHYEQVKMALENGVNVIVEKPMSTKPEQVAELFDLAATKNLVLMEAIKTCSMTTYQSICDNLHLIGNLQSFRFNMMRSYENFPDIGERNIPNIYKQEFDGGVINDLGSYALFPLIDFIGDQDYNINTITNTSHLEVPVNLIANVHAVDNKIHGLITLSMLDQDDSLSYIRGNDGYLTIDSLSQFNNVKFYDLDNNLKKEFTRLNSHLMTSEILHLLDLIQSNKIESKIHNKRKSLSVAKLIQQIENA